MTTVVRPGRLRTVVDVQRQVETQDAAGQPIVTWVSRGRTRAHIKPISGREFFAGFDAQTTLGEARARITLRYRSDIVIKDRIVDVYGGDVWDVEVIIDMDNRHHVLEVLALRKEQ